MIVPAPRCALLVAASAPVCAVLATAFPDAALASLYLPILALALSIWDLLVLPSGKLVGCELKAPGLLYVGKEGLASLVLSFPEDGKPFKAKFFLETEGVSLKSLPKGEIDAKSGKGEACISLCPAMRGSLEIKNLWLSWRGPMGFLEARKKIALGQSLPVIQDVQGLHEEALKYFTKDFSIGQKLQPVKGLGSEFENLAEYSVGMDNRFIDWKRSARHRRLLAKEFRPERNNRIILCFDTGRLMLEPIDGKPRLDGFVRAGLMLGWISLRNGDLVGSASFDLFFRNFLSPGRTPSFFLKLQKFTSSLSYETTETNFTLCLSELAGRLRHRSLVVLFTEFSDSVSSSLLLESLELMTRKHLVVFVSMPDPASSLLPGASPETFRKMAASVIADGFKRERAIVLERMARLGVHALDLPPGKLSGALINRYIMIKQRGLL
jgi:uncharacterized protein (DUF58 family)